MESKGSETSSEENDREEQVNHGVGSAKRSYECTFCKRGFTNAQALGGHMNIHRKDRAKAAKPLTGSSSLPHKPDDDDYIPSRYSPQDSGEPPNYFPVLEAQWNFQPSASSPRVHQHAYFHETNMLASLRPQSLSMEQEHLGANLSLRIGPGHMEDDEVNRGVNKDDEEVDLELRLGHDPY